MFSMCTMSYRLLRYPVLTYTLYLYMLNYDLLECIWYILLLPTTCYMHWGQAFSKSFLTQNLHCVMCTYYIYLACVFFNKAAIKPAVICASTLLIMLSNTGKKHLARNKNYSYLHLFMIYPNCI